MTDTKRLVDVLVVEDNTEIADITLRTLNRMGIEARWASDGHQAKAILNEGLPDLILLDLNLGEMDGWHVLEYAKKLHGETNLKVVVMTAADDSANRVIGKLQPVIRYLVKPVERAVLVKTVNEILGLA